MTPFLMLNLDNTNDKKIEEKPTKWIFENELFPDISIIQHLYFKAHFL